MRPNRRATNIPVRWQPYAELTAAAAAACGGEGSILDTSLLGGGRSSGIVERNLLSQFKGDAKMQVTDDRPEPSLALSLRVGSEEEPQPQPQNRLRHAPTRQSPRLLSRPAGSSVPLPPQTYYAPASSPAGVGLAPQLQLGSNSLPFPLPLGATPPGARAALRRVQPPLRSFGGGLAEGSFSW